jgi:hypothetical protein
VEVNGQIFTDPIAIEALRRAGVIPPKESVVSVPSGSEDSGDRVYLSVGPGVVRYQARLFPVNDGDTEWTPEALAGMAGQSAPGGIEGVQRFIIVRAWIEDGWVKAEIKAVTEG